MRLLNISEEPWEPVAGTGSYAASLTAYRKKDGPALDV
jgi:hypothetical protein